MNILSLIFLFGLFTPGLIRGAFWYDSPSADGIFWTIATIGFVLAVGWVAGNIFGNGLGPTIAMVLAVVVANAYALKGSTFSSSKKKVWR